MEARPYTGDEVFEVLRRKCEELLIDDEEDGSRYAYWHAGKFLGTCLWRLIPDGCPPEEWQDRLRRLRDEANPAEAVRWLERELPSLIGLIPVDHRELFAGAAIQAVGPSGSDPLRHQSRWLTRRSRNRKRAERRKKTGS